MKKIFLLFMISSSNLFAETGYRYIPPNSEYGKLCVNQCNSSKYQCQQLEQLKKENANLRATQEDITDRQYRSIDIQECMAKYSGNKEKQKRKCNDDLGAGLDLLDLLLGEEEPENKRDVCKEQFLNCFSNCGGKIEQITFDSY